MLKKSITYKNFLDEEVTEDFYFNLTKGEALEINMRNDLQAIAQTQDRNKVFDNFTRILRKAYGVRSAEGRRFFKKDSDIREFTAGLTFDEFFASDAYSVLFMEFMQDAAKAADFIKQILPADFDQTAVQAGQPQDFQQKTE